MNLKDLSGEDGMLLWVDPGGYPILYYTADGGILCPGCANGANGSEASETSDCDWCRLIGGDVYYEGPPETCEHCNAVIESAYGDPEEGQQ